MNFKTFLILFLLGVSCSCTISYEHNFGGGETTEEKESGTANK